MRQQTLFRRLDAEQGSQAEKTVDLVAPEAYAAKDAPYRAVHHQRQNDHDQQDGAEIVRPFFDENLLVIGLEAGDQVAHKSSAP